MLTRKVQKLLFLVFILNLTLGSLVFNITAIIRNIPDQAVQARRKLLGGQEASHTIVLEI